ncbi:uncharacterized protein [Nicotiana sylvestris]|uniref:uncharacterized protein n=1 Tax=Nicotiana sylvestris TaxID=4096 RepID=UPI00388CA556
MRPPPPGEEEISKPPKEKKRKRGSSANTPRQKKINARNPKADTEEKEEDDDCLLVARERGSPDASKTDDPTATDVVQSRIEEISEGSSSKVPESSGKKGSPSPGGIWQVNSKSLTPRPFKDKITPQAMLLHRREFSISRTELASSKAELKKVSEERDNLKILYVKNKREIGDLRFHHKGELVLQLQDELKMKEAETLGWRQGMENLVSDKETLREQLASLERQLQSVKEESLSRGHEIEGLKARSAVELAKAKSDAEVIASSYQANAEATNARAKEISTAAEVKLSSELDHARRQSGRVTLEEVHARGFDLSADIERAKILEEEAAALLSDEDDSVSGSESGGDEDEVPEGEALDDFASAAAEDMTPK